MGLTSARVADVSIFSPTDNWLGVATRRFEARALGLPDWIARIFSNKLVYSFSTFSQNYISYFSPIFFSCPAPASRFTECCRVGECFI